MRQPVVGNISTKDGTSNKNSRLTNMLAEQKKSGATLATMRPGLNEYGNGGYPGYGLVCFGGSLISIYGANLMRGVWGVEYVLDELGTLGGSQSLAYAISSDGTTIAGSSATSGGQEHACIWSVDGFVIQDLGTLGGTNSRAFGISEDGTTVVGRSQITGDSAYHAFRWTSGDGMVDLGVKSGEVESEAKGCSSDGSVVVGYSYGGAAPGAFRWTSGGGMVDIGNMYGGGVQALGCSANGNVIVGMEAVGLNYSPFRWVSGSGMTDLGDFGGAQGGAAYACSSDGSVVVGFSWMPDNITTHAFRWTSGDGMVDINDGLFTLSAATCVSPDGLIIGGAGSNGSLHGMLWDSDNGMSDISSAGETLCYVYGVTNAKKATGFATVDVPTNAFYTSNTLDVLSLENVGTVPSSIGKFFDFALIP